MSARPAASRRAGAFAAGDEHGGASEISFPSKTYD